MLKNIFTQFYKKEINYMNGNNELKETIEKQLGFPLKNQDTRVSKQLPLRPRFVFSLIGVFAVVLIAIFLQYPSKPDDKIPLRTFTGPLVDDWQNFKTEQEMGGFGTVMPAVPSSGSKNVGLGTGLAPASGELSLGLSESIGFSTGGAKDIENFRLNIENGFFPQLTDITYEGLFYDYFFDTGADEACETLFCPSYREAVTKNPFSEETEYYLSVGLNSGIKQSDFARKKLNLIVVLDISGSMSSPFNEYYYDGQGNRVLGDSRESSQKSKMEVATESLVGLLNHLDPEDRFGVVLFDDSAQVVKPMRFVGETDMPAIKNHILEIAPRGGTNLSSGMNAATELMKEFRDAPTSEYENRIIFLTDAMPNLGQYGEDDLFGITEKNANDRVYSTFIGIGVDFQTELIEAITKIRGANYYSVHSTKEFTDRMDTGFDYMVTPLVFDLQLDFEAEGFAIEEVYGSPEANKATGNLMYVNTLFPSERKNNETRGGLVLLKLKKLSDKTDATVRVRFEDREGNKMSSTRVVSFGGQVADYYDNTGIRKGVVLARYGELLKNWILSERLRGEEPVTDDWSGDVIEPLPVVRGFDEWEQQSVKLRVSNEYRTLFQKFRTYLVREMDAVNDSTLRQEVEVLDLLINS